MTIFGKRLSEYIAFCSPFLGLILVVGIVRLALSLGGAPNSTARWLSVTAIGWIGALYYAVRVHTTGFGSYRHLLPIYVLQALVTQLVVVPSIILAIITNTNNIYSSPEYAFGNDGKTWLHAAAHLFLGTTIAPLIWWLVGSLVMFVTKRLTTRTADPRATARI